MNLGEPFSKEWATTEIHALEANTKGSVRILEMSRHKRGPGEGSDPSLRKEPPKGEEGGALFEE